MKKLQRKSAKKFPIAKQSNYEPGKHTEIEICVLVGVTKILERQKWNKNDEKKRINSTWFLFHIMEV